MYLPNLMDLTVKSRTARPCRLETSLVLSVFPSHLLWAWLAQGVPCPGPAVQPLVLIFPDLEQTNRPTPNSYVPHTHGLLSAAGSPRGVDHRCPGGPVGPPLTSRCQPLPPAAGRLTCQRRCWRFHQPAHLSPARRVGGLAQMRQVPK